MKRNYSVCLVLIMFAALLLTPASHSAPITAPPQDNTTFRFRTITVRHKLTDSETDPWITTELVSPKSIWLQFSVEFDPKYEVPAKVLLSVQLRRLCRLEGSGGHFLTTRFKDYFTQHQEEVTVTKGIADIALKVHCPSCPHPKVCVFSGSDADSDGDPDHLGEGPYEALITANGSGSGVSLRSHSTQTSTPPSQLVHSMYFSTCVRQCPAAITTEGGIKTLLSPKTGSKKKGNTQKN